MYAPVKIISKNKDEKELIIMFINTFDIGKNNEK